MDLHSGEEIVFDGHPSWRSILGYHVKGTLAVAAAGALGGLADGLWLGVGCATLVALIVLFSGLLKRIDTRYTITNERLRIRRGILARHVQETRIERVQNVNTTQTFLERILKVGTVDFDTAGGETAEDFVFAGVSDPAAVVAAVDRVQRTGTPPPV